MLNSSFLRRLAAPALLFPLLLGTGACGKLEPKNCGEFQPTPLVNYEILDARTGRSIFTSTNPITTDSVRVIDQTTPPDRYGRELNVVRYMGRVTMGPDYVLRPTAVPEQGGVVTFTKHLKLGAHDTDTIVIRATFAAAVQTECGRSQKLSELAFTYNNQPVGTYNYAVPTDSTFQFGLQPYGKLLKLRKRY